MKHLTQFHVIPYRGFTITLVFDKSSRVWSGTSGDISVDARSTAEGEELFKAAVDDYLEFSPDNAQTTVYAASEYANIAVSDSITYVPMSEWLNDWGCVHNTIAPSSWFDYNVSVTNDATVINRRRN